VIATATLAGLGRALRSPRLVVVLWLVKLALAAAVALPAWLALRAWIGVLPGADPLREGLSFGIFADLAEQRPGFFGGLVLSAFGLGALGLLVGLAAAGGVLQVLLDRDAGPVAGRFGRGALHFFGRFLRVGLLAAPVAGVAIVLAAAPFALLIGRSERSGSEALNVATRLAVLVAASLAAIVMLAGIDAARIAIVRGEACRAWPALLGGLRRVLRRPVRWVGAWLANALLVALVLAVHALAECRLPGSSGAWLLVGFVIAQLAAFAQSGLRVALFASEIALFDAQPATPAPAQALLEPLPAAESPLVPEPTLPVGEDGANRPK
jgi:hypothetical protein